MVLVAASAITAISLGVRSTFGLFLGPITEALHTNRAGFALAIAIQNLVWGIAQPVAGAIADRFGAARVLAVGGLLYTIGVGLMANARSTLGFDLGGGVVVGLGLAAASFAVVLASVGRLAPPERRTWAMGVATAAGSMGQFILVQVVGRLDADQWRTALAVLATLTATIALVCIPLRGGRNPATANPGAAATGALAVETETLRHALRRALHHRPYLLLVAGFFVCGFHITFIGTHLPAYLNDVGLARADGTRALSIIGLFNIAGSFAAGWLGMRHSKAKLLAGIYAIRALAIVGLVVTPHTSANAIIFAALIGTLWLATVPLTSGIVVGHFGVTHAGSLFGLVFLSHQVGAFVGVWYGGKLADSVGSYNPVWWIAAVLGVVAMVVHLFIDESPAPLEPAAPSGRVGRSLLRPITGTAVVLLVAALAFMGRDVARAGGATVGVVSSNAPLFCPLHTFAFVSAVASTEIVDTRGGR